MKKRRMNDRRCRPFSPVMTCRGEDLKPRYTREENCAWALKWDGAALSAVRGRKRSNGPTGA